MINLSSGLEISSVSDAVLLLDDPQFVTFTKTNRLPPYQEPFGIWFRGEPPSASELKPSIWREPRDEPSLVYHFMLRASDRRPLCQNSFDWLCLMRHFEMPARLLDWTESLIIGLYFAVRDQGSGDRTLWVLNTRRLNEITRCLPPKHTGIATPWSIDTGLRAESSRARTRNDYVDQISSFDRNHAEDADTFRKLLDTFRGDPKDIPLELSKPIAVFPNRLDGRMIFQQSVFTLHGGIDPNAPRVYDATTDVGFPEQCSLIDLSLSLPHEEDFLLRIRVTAADEIRRQLKYMGIHDGSLFPELDKQARYVEDFWTQR